MKITEKIYNAETGEETIFERDETKQETKERLDAEKAAKAYADAKAQADAEKAAILARLGLTEDELKTILG
jgi:predicted DNA-binding WGR domain protein